MKTHVKPKTKVDRLDLRIISALAERGRQTFTDLSKAIGLSLSPCTARVERLETADLILGYHADIDVEQLADLSLFFVTISLEPYNQETAKKIEAALGAIPFVVAADALFGARDYLVRIYARSTQHYYEIIAPFTELGADCETWPVSRSIVRPQLHRLAAQLKREAG